MKEMPIKQGKNLLKHDIDTTKQKVMKAKGKKEIHIYIHQTLKQNKVI